jgi:ABC-type glycerol-3-phosphate transport system permease component
VIGRSLNRIVGRIGYYGVLSVIALFALGPALWVVLSSFKTGTQVFSGSGLFPHHWTLRGYGDAFTQVHLHRYLLNTLLYAGGGTIGSLVVALLAAYPLARFEFLGRNAMVAIFSLALAIPVVGMATPEFFIMRELGLYDSQLGLVVFYSALMFPLAFVILRAFLVNIPSEVEEAAVIDGAGYFTVMRKIVVPLSRPALATVAVISFVSIWNEFFFANLFTASVDHQNAQLALAGFKSLFGFNVSGMLAGATIVMLVPVLVFLLLQRQVIEGLTAGSSK